jgi:hypothetical protein
MPQYMLSVHTTDGAAREPMTEEQQREGYARIAGIEADMEAVNALVLSARLTGPQEAKVVRSTRRRVKANDGPFVETKEHLGGFYLVDTPDLDAALDWASRVSEAIGEAIEVRALAGSRAPRSGG